jgi:hypothetical protein
MQNAFNPTPKVGVSTLIKSLKFKAFSEAQSNLLTITTVKSKKKKPTYFQHIMAQNIYYQMGRKGAKGKNTGPKQDQKPAGQTPNSASPPLMSKHCSELQLLSTLFVTHF